MSNIKEESLSHKIQKTCDLVDNWVANELKASNSKLYSLLSNCMKLCEEIRDNKDYRLELDDLLKDRKVKITGQASMRAKVIRLCFPNLRQRWNVYTKVLDAAHSAGKTSTELAAWIEERGGVENIRLGGKAKASSADDTFSILADQRLKAIKSTVKVDMNFHSKLTDCDVLVLGHVNSNGKVELYEAISNQRMIEDFKRILGKSLAEAGELASESDAYKQNRIAIDQMAREASEADNEKAA